MVSRGERDTCYTHTQTYIHTRTHTLANLKHEVANFNSEKEQKRREGRIFEERNHEYRESRRAKRRRGSNS